MSYHKDQSAILLLFTFVAGTFMGNALQQNRWSLTNDIGNKCFSAAWRDSDDVFGSGHHTPHWTRTKPIRQYCSLVVGSSELQQDRHTVNHCLPSLDLNLWHEGLVGLWGRSPGSLDYLVTLNAPPRPPSSLSSSTQKPCPPSSLWLKQSTVDNCSTSRHTSGAEVCKTWKTVDRFKVVSKNVIVLRNLCWIMLFGYGGLKEGVHCLWRSTRIGCYGFFHGDTILQSIISVLLCWCVCTHECAYVTEFSLKME